MAIEQGNPEEIPLDPSLKVRLAWWFGIYFAAQLPLIGAIACFFLFPIGLIRIVIPTSTAQDDGILLRIAVFGSYLIYLIHLIATLSVRSKTVFQILLAILVVIVVLNLVGCGSIIKGFQNVN